MTLLAHSSYRYKIIDHSRHTVTKYLSEEKANTAINIMLFNKLDYVNNSLDEV